MKKTVFFIGFICLSITITAQSTKEYNGFIQSIDSVKSKYAVKRFLYAGDFHQSFQANYGNRLSQLSIDEQNSVIDYVCELYNQKEYIGLYRLAGELLKGFYNFSNEEKIKTRIIDIWYDKICYMSSSVGSIGNSEYYSEYAKNRLLAIVAKQWTEEDIAAWTIFIKQLLNIESYKRDVQRIMKESNRKGNETENYLLDSLIQQGVEKNLQKNMNASVSEKCIYMIGSLKDERFIPYLEKMLSTDYGEERNEWIKEACTYALAKLGVQKYIDEAYTMEYINFEYLGTKEAFLKWLEKSFVWNKGDRLYSDVRHSPKAIVSLIRINYYLKLPQEIKGELWGIEFNCFTPESIATYDPNKDEQNRDVIEKAYKLYNWIKNNPDKWEIPPAKDYK
jgi:hypothetical protein